MILQALKDYYERKISDSNSSIAPRGFENKEIPFIIVLDNDGNLVHVEDTRYQLGKQKRAKSFLIPQSEKISSGINANLLWDNAERSLGICSKSKPERVVKLHAMFVDRIKQLELEQDAGVAAILKFMENNPAKRVEESKYGVEIKKKNPFIVFRLYSDIDLISARRVVVEKIKNSSFSTCDDGNRGTCLVTGCDDVISDLHPAIKGVRNANSTGGNLVSFNLGAFNSFGKEQGRNAPIGGKATFAYTTALNYLLRKDSEQKIQIGDATTVFWSDKKSDLENNFSTLFDQPPKDNPDALTEAVKALYKAIEVGGIPIEDKQTRFFVLGLSPNNARVSVRFWQVGTIAEFSQKIIQHFQDLTIGHASYQDDYLPMWQMLKSIAVRGDIKKAPPNLVGDWMRAILTGSPYPDSLYHAALRRIRTEKKISYQRAAIIKAYLNRKNRFTLQTEKEVLMSLDNDNRNIGYRLGRLFATLEKIQQEAQPKINTTIGDRYYSSASRTPGSVFPILLRLKQHHLEKIGKEKYGRTIYFERLIGEIFSEIKNFPAQLNLQDQGRFAIGCYHQRQKFFEKSESTANTKEN